MGKDTKRCNTCKKVKSAAAFYKRYGKCKVCVLKYAKKYRDSNRDLILEKSRIRRRELGIKPLDQTPNKTIRIGRKAEKLVYRKLSKLGIKAFLGSGRGVDIFGELSNRRKFSMEVKKTVKTSEGKSWYVCAVSPNQIKNEWIAIVHGEHIFIQKMKQHLKFTGKKGWRTVTHICRVLDEIRTDIIPACFSV